MNRIESEVQSAESSARAGRAFTLIELLVVIAVISLLAGLVFPVTGAVNRAKVRSKARVELAQIQMAIESYHDKRGHFPPDNPGNPLVNQLYYELLGAKAIVDAAGRLTDYQTLDGSSQLSVGDVSAVFGSGVAGFVNSAKGSGGDEAVSAMSFLKGGLKATQIGQIDRGARILVCSVPWPANVSPILPGYPGLSPFCYNSSSPTNNTGSFDLCVDVIIAGKTNRISNWSKEPLIVSRPYPFY